MEAIYITKIPVSGKKNVRLFDVIKKTSVLSDKNVPLHTYHCGMTFKLVLNALSQKINQGKGNTHTVHDKL